MDDPLKVHILSFSYHKTGIPGDRSGHGGGFVFDCRFLPNPGREEGYMELDGRDEPVRAFLHARPEVESFWVHVRGIVDAAVDAFGERGFTDMTFAFGCTGGQHRSVFFAERLFAHLSSHDCNCRLSHVDLEPETS